MKDYCKVLASPVKNGCGHGGIIMKLNKVTVARVAATIIDGASPEVFGQYAEQDLPYRLPDSTCLYVVGRSDTKVPIKELTDLKYSPLLILVLPYDAITIRTLPVLWLIDVARGYSAFSMISYNLHIIVVADVGKDSFTHQIKYGIIRFPSAKDLFDDINKQVGSENKEHLKKMWASHQWDGSTGADAARLCNEYVNGALKARLTRSPNTCITLSE
jgi:hypothetical protein